MGRCYAPNSVRSQLVAFGTLGLNRTSRRMSGTLRSSGPMAGHDVGYHARHGHPGTARPTSARCLRRTHPLPGAGGRWPDRCHPSLRRAGPRLATPSRPRPSGASSKTVEPVAAPIFPMRFSVSPGQFRCRGICNFGVEADDVQTTNSDTASSIVSILLLIATQQSRRGVASFQQ